jgi:hypothetical protein
MPKLSFISDEVLNQEVLHLLAIASKAKKQSEINFTKNVIDPFAVLFEMSGFDVTETAWETGEKNRQIQKTLQNHVGAFHQRILGCVDGWQDAGKGGVVDLISEKHKIVAEIKNKFNTVKGSDKVKIYDSLESQVMNKGHQFRGYTAYYVEVIPQFGQRYDREFTPSDNAKGQQRKANPIIRQIDGYSFYGLVIGVPDALSQLFSVLPDVIEANSKYKFANRDFAQDFFHKAFK